MHTEQPRDTQHGAIQAEVPAVAALMHLLANLNAGALLALCFWLAWAAMDYTARQPGNTTSTPVSGCSCSLTEVANWSGRIDVALRN